MRVALGALMHESNTFAPGRTTLEDFRRTQFLTGADIVEAHAGTGSEVGGALEELARRSVEVVPTFPIHPVEEAVRMGRAVPGRPVVLNELADCTLGGASGDVVSTARYRDVHGHTSIHSGYETPLGKIAVVEGRGLAIVLIERAGKLGGPTFLEEVGLDPADMEFIVVKEGLNPLVTYKDVAASILMVDSPGFDRQIPRPRDYRRLRRPVYPLDPEMSWDPED